MTTMLLVLVLFASAAVAHAEIFKCSKAGGTVVYQNFPCDIDSIGSSATAPMPADPKPTASTVQASAHSSSDEHVTLPLPKAPSAFAKPEPRIGMTRRQVRHQSWGEPVDISQVQGSKGAIETWTYGDNRKVLFDEQGRVTAFQ